MWRIRRRERASVIDVFKTEETGHGDILSDEFINWRIRLALGANQANKGMAGRASKPGKEESSG